MNSIHVLERHRRGAEADDELFCISCQLIIKNGVDLQKGQSSQGLPGSVTYHRRSDTT